MAMNAIRSLLGMHQHHRGETHIVGFGARDIGWLGSSTLVCNNVRGWRGAGTRGRGALLTP